MVPPDIDGAERWIIGSAYHEHVGTAYTRVFDVHAFDFIQSRRMDAWAFYASQDKPVYLIERTPEIPSSVTYPRRALDAFGPRGTNAISSTVDHMMALALLEGFTDIHLCGVRLISIEEWVSQRECLAYWIGRCDERGVNLITDPVAALCTPEVVYGFGEKTGARRAPGQPVIVQGMPVAGMVPV